MLYKIINNLKQSNFTTSPKAYFIPKVYAPEWVHGGGEGFTPLLILRVGRYSESEGIVSRWAGEIQAPGQHVAGLQT